LIGDQADWSLIGGGKTGPYCSSAVPLANRMTSSRPTCLSVCLSVRVENFSETSAQLEEGNNLPRSKPLSTGGFFVAGLRGLWIGFT